MHSFIPIAAIALATPVVARAGEPDYPPLTAISFADAIGASETLPELAGARAAAVATSLVEVSRPWAPFILTFAPSLRLAPRGQREIEGGVTIQQAIPIDDLGRARRDHVQAISARRAADVVALALDARLAAAAAWIDGWTAREHLETAERDLVLARSIAEVTERGAAAGAFTGPELADARAFVAEATVRRIDAEGMVADAAFTLAATTGRNGRVLAEGPLPAPAVPSAETWPVLVERARSLPAVTARRLAARADRARAIEEHRSRGHQLVLGGELLRDGPGALAAIATIGISFPHDRGEREVALALADAVEADGQADGLAVRAAVDLARVLHDVEHTGEVLAVLEQSLVPAADDAARRRKRAFELGETTVVELLTAQRTALAAHAQIADARARHAWARVRAWLLIQTTEVVR